MVQFYHVDHEIVSKLWDIASEPKNTESITYLIIDAFEKYKLRPAGVQNLAINRSVR